jgi:hypothetical protein
METNSLTLALVLGLSSISKTGLAAAEEAEAAAAAAAAAAVAAIADLRPRGLATRALQDLELKSGDSIFLGSAVICSSACKAFFVELSQASLDLLQR